MDLEDITLGVISETEKDKYYTTLLYMESKKAKFIETKSRLVVARSWGVGKMGDIGQRV